LIATIASDLLIIKSDQVIINRRIHDVVVIILLHVTSFIVSPEQQPRPGRFSGKQPRRPDILILGFVDTIDRSVQPARTSILEYALSISFALAVVA
jgi:hypothetical protein